MVKLFGLTVESLQTNAGFGGTGRSEMRISLAQDPADGDSPSWPAGGSPVSLTYGALNFTGIFQQFSQSQDVSGYPRFNALISDPSEILNSCTLITELYNGPSLVTNIVNIYGYYENALGFGGAEANDIGMTWDKLLYAIDNIINNTAGTYGGPIDFKGYAYGIDLSDMPTIPADYRVSINGGTLLDLITTVCRDAGFDPFFILDGANVKVKTVDRNAAIDPDALVNWIASGPLTGIVSRSAIGMEIRNEPTSALLVGGQKSSVYVSTSFASYWGDDVSGNPIIGTSAVHTDLPSEPCENFTLPATEVADCLGATTYATNTIEIRCVLAGENTWHQYISKYKPTVAALFGPLFGGNTVVVNAKIDRLNTKRAKLLPALDEVIRLKSHLMYHYLLKYAQEFYGKKFLVQIPDVLSYGPTTAIPNKISSHEIDQAGYINGGGAAIGLGALDSVKFESGDGRIVAFATVPNADTIDAGGLDPQNMSIVSNVIYTRTNVQARILRPGGISAVVVSFESPFLERKALLAGVVGLIVNYAGSDASRLGAFGNAPLTVYPNYITPTNFGIPLRSNTEVYGPWYAQGAPGKVQYQQDSSLVPWAFNSVSILNDVGNARVSTMASSQPSNNSGEIVLAGIPLYSLSDVPQSGGPPIASIDMRYGVSGFLTTYQFATFSIPNRGAYAREYQVVAQKNHELAQDTRRKVIRQAAKNVLIQQGVKDAQEARFFRKNLENWIKRESPHEAFVGQVYMDTGNGELRIGVSTATQEEALALSNADNNNWYKNTAIMGLTGLFCPFESVDNTTESSGLVPKSYLQITSGSTYRGTNSGIFASDYFPFAPPHPTEGLTWGNAYNNYNSRQNRIEATSPLQSATGVRAVGLRGPMWLTGFGQGINYVATGGTFPTGGGSKMSVSSYKSGPIDHIWDDWRGVWTSHDVYSGVSRHFINLPLIGGIETVPLVSMSGNTGRNFYVYSNSTIPSGMDVITQFVANRPNGSSLNFASFLANRALPGSWYGNLTNPTGSITQKNLADIIGLDEGFGLTSTYSSSSPTTASINGISYTWGASPTSQILIRGKAATTGNMGMVTTTTQIFGGLKTFNNGAYINENFKYSVTGVPRLSYNAAYSSYDVVDDGLSFDINSQMRVSYPTGNGVASTVFGVGSDGGSGLPGRVWSTIPLSITTPGVSEYVEIDGNGITTYGFGSGIKINTLYGGIATNRIVLGNNILLRGEYDGAPPSGGMIDKIPIYANDNATIVGYIPVYDM